MSNPRAPARQRFYGPMYGDPLAQSIPHLTGQNPDTVARMRRNYGRYLAGFGGESMSGQVGYDPRYQGQEVYDLEKEDDTYGSGIFDPKGREGTSNPNMGVFASHNSLPGYIARDVPFTVSRDVTDITDNASVVSVPGGGMAYVERHGRLSGAAITGPTWRPPQIEPAGYTRHDQVYAKMTRPGARGSYLNAAAPDRAPAPSMRPSRVQQPVHSVPGFPYERLVPTEPSSHRVATKSIVHARQVSVPVRRAAHPVAPAAPGMPMGPQVPFRQTVNVAPSGPPIPIEGYGGIDGPTKYSSLQHMTPGLAKIAPRYLTSKHVSPGGVFGQVVECPEGQAMDIDTGQCVETPQPKKPASTAQLAFAGLVIGVATGLLVGVVRKKG